MCKIAVHVPGTQYVSSSWFSSLPRSHVSDRGLVVDYSLQSREILGSTTDWCECTERKHKLLKAPKRGALFEP